MDWYEILKPVLYAALSILSTIIGIYVKRVGTKATEYFKSKVDKDTYAQAVEVAKGLYIYLEDKYEDVVQAGNTKMIEMGQLLSEKFPNLTQAELDSINKTVWLSFQEGYQGTYANKLNSKDNSED